MSEKLIIYHGPYCHDGLTAAWAALHRWPDAEIFSANYGQEPPWDRIGGADVAIVDFSYSRNTLTEINKRANTLVVLDHHKTAKDDLKGLAYCKFDMDKSGAMLAWEWAHDGLHVEPPRLVKYVQDRDLWNYYLPLSLQINACIRSHPLTLDALSMCAEALEHPEGFDQFVAEGSAILRYQSQVVENHKKYAKIDCSILAKEMGGGGHAQAAGFRTKLSPDEILFESIGDQERLEGSGSRRSDGHRG